jgi:hypothetical protein
LRGHKILNKVLCNIALSIKLKGGASVEAKVQEPDTQSAANDKTVYPISKLDEVQLFDSQLLSSCGSSIEVISEFQCH